VPIPIQIPWGRAVDPDRLDETLRSNPDAKIVAFVQAETSTGALSDAQTLVEIAHRHDCLTIVDAVTALGGCELEVDAWDIDAVYAGTQKCLSCVPGLAPLSMNERALERLKTRESKVQSWFMDLRLVLGYWGAGQKRAYHHTAPVNALYGLHEALVMLHDEGIENAWSRHRRNHLALRAGLEAMGLELIVPEAERLPQLNAVSIPAGVDDAAVRSRLLNEFNLEIGAGLGDLAGKVWRIGIMGFSGRLENILLCVGALGATLNSEGMPVDTGAALSAVHAASAGAAARD
jgi:alanine-glyoxylate transaminase/serine-glyoxylate transaminase/serine-pyruvate transaminase